MTLDNRYRLAELRDQPDALEAIQRLEEQLSERSGSDIALVAYAAEQDQNGQN
ncbi:hypothetical protein RB620_26680 [Paenibacillus sp. LHD-117]|uniref:hypothetical protein n=1 Tax=Paenibacillus sp. LHD-117 TaxID=3071412 RepID=UPI0027E00B33|nr:hypothetical protein [Paenibacillus sp. LHD-117]MDQ6423019.1 hypothetical protein [Paenibacillus sp. LHD-117]